jgi:hypothetical protein
MFQQLILMKLSNDQDEKFRGITSCILLKNRSESRKEINAASF